jgi:hypothetical protein
MEMRGLLKKEREVCAESRKRTSTLKEECNSQEVNKRRKAIGAGKQ